jgi:hypothetical protein
MQNDSNLRVLLRRDCQKKSLKSAYSNLKNPNRIKRRGIQGIREIASEGLHQRDCCCQEKYVKYVAMNGIAGTERRKMPTINQESSGLFAEITAGVK